MKTKILFIAVLFAAACLTSCLENDDLMTADAKVGGLLNPSGFVQYLPESSQGVDVDILIYQGPAVKAIKVYKQFVHLATGKTSDYILLDNINVDGQNTADTLELSKTYEWGTLIQGITYDDYTLPDDPKNADIGDYFLLKYVSVLDDDREVTSNATTQVLVANSYAGYYMSYITFFHPLFGSYPDQPYYEDYPVLKQLVTLDGSTCYTDFGLWGSQGETIYLTFNPDNSISLEVEAFDYIVQEGDPNNSLLYSHYDPITSNIYLYYNYSGPGGERIIWEVLEPINNK